jgi:hypothetical protein
MCWSGPAVLVQGAVEAAGGAGGLSAGPILPVIGYGILAPIP